MTRTRRYHFDEQLQQGEQGEAVLDGLFCHRFAVLPASRADQRRGIDRHYVSLDGERLAVEYKTDWTAARTGNAFVETVSVDTARKPGWALSSQADYLFYYIPPDGLVYILRFAILRARLPVWQRHCRTVRVPNDGYATHGLLVPLREFEALAEIVLSI